MSWFNLLVITGQNKISVPFERVADLKDKIEARRHWKRLDAEWDYFESDWAPKC
jgi:hypothetical protein